ncbi:TetR/AcrR family transcriptional regulator [Chondrinema litorale]|uniref:TetR/AcrR family transcriptional regulator n=1 Tax=Chondrinema litorale TaxID=2994555 RepID=UPI0025447121|nr:TetR/AcrR family transcriptional regulator [Chondrinema litorale]UZR94725.1 TetR family transcriptional regulator C-terminal domain-containing protein [Chondrinema litorale]
MKTEVRDRILDIGVDIIAKKGYNGIGIMEVLNEAKIPKGSFYHYFKSKEDFGVKVIERYSESTLQYISSFLADATLSPLQRIFALFDDVQKLYMQREFKEGCLLGNSSTELGGQKVCFSTVLEREFLNMENTLIKCLKEAKDQGELKTNMPTEELASFIVNSWEGAILRMKVSKSLEPIKSFIKFLKVQILI